jgi:DNA-binding NarL/FixJ family response regulator
MLQVMLIERECIIREILKDNLQKNFPSMVITEVVNGEDGLLKIQEAPPRLIFIDLQLPEVTGVVGRS